MISKQYDTCIFVCPQQVCNLETGCRIPMLTGQTQNPWKFLFTGAVQQQECYLHILYIAIVHIARDIWQHIETVQQYIYRIPDIMILAVTLRQLYETEAEFFSSY